MGLIEEITSALLGGGRSGGASNDQVGALIKGVLESLGGEGDDAGVEGLDRRFQQGGSGDVFSSWVGTGSNRAIGPDILSQILKGHPIEQAPPRAGLGGAAGAAILAQLLPLLIDKLTPNGRVPERSQLREMSNQLARGDAPFARPEMAFMSSGDKPKPDFSNVKSGASSTAPPPPAAPKAAEPRTYTVVAGDNLSKIAKKFYGDANKWKKLFEANKDTIKNPDLIKIGQVLRVPE
jgi:nucleoid-associated protein YgaU